MSHVNNQKPLITFQEPMNVRRAITEIRSTGREKIMQQYLTHGNLQDITKTSKREEKGKIAIWHDIILVELLSDSIII